MVTLTFDPVVLIVGIGIGFFLGLAIFAWVWGSR